MNRQLDNFNTSKAVLPYTEVFYGELGRQEFLEARIDEKLGELTEKHSAKGIQDISLHFDVLNPSSREPEFECGIKMMTRNGKVLFAKKSGPDVLGVFEATLASVEKSLKRDWMKRRRGLRMVDPRRSNDIFSGIDYS